MTRPALVDPPVDLSGLERSIEKICALVDRLRAERAELREAIQVVSRGRVAGELCWCDEIAIASSHEHSGACLAARAAIARVEAA